MSGTVPMGPDDWRLRRQLARRPDGGEQVEAPATCLRRFARTGILPVGCPCVLRWSRGKAMEMSHSGLVRLPAKEVGVEAPREFESPHLRHRESPGAQQRAGASSLPEHPSRRPRRPPNGRRDRESALRSQRSPLADRGACVSSGADPG